MLNLEQFDKRYSVEPCPLGHGFYIADGEYRKIEAGPMPTRQRAEGVLAFMRQHVAK